MRRPQRNIEIFSMSVLDMFASALGAFIIISIILFPYFNRDMQIKMNKEKQETAKASIVKQEDASKKIAETIETYESEIRGGREAFAALGQCRQIAALCAAALQKAFLVIGIEWDEDSDVDLYITDPRGNQYSYSRKRFDGSEGELSLDMTWGPGIEVWQNADAARGDYTIAYNLASAKGAGQVKVKGWWIDRARGRQELPERSLQVTSSRVKVGVLHLNADGSTELVPEGRR